MTFTPIPRGSNVNTWDVPVNDAFTSQDARITSNEGSISSLNTLTTTHTSQIAALGVRDDVLEDATNEYNAIDYGLITQVYDLATAGAATSPAFGTVHMQKVKVNRTKTVNNLGIDVSTAGTAMVANQNFLGIYNGSGTLLGQTADQSVAWATVGYKQANLVTPVVITPGYYYLAFLANGATLAFIRGSNFSAAASLVSLNHTAADGRFATTNPGSTVLPSSVTMASRTLTSTAFWMAAG